MITATAGLGSTGAGSPTVNPPAPNESEQTLSATGSRLSPSFTLNNGVTVFRIKHSGLQAFSVLLTDGHGKCINQLISAKGAFDGAPSLGLEPGANYALDVQADGAWSALVQQPVPSASDLNPPPRFSGRNAQASPFLAFREGTFTFLLSYTGTSGAAIGLFDKNGVRQVLPARGGTSNIPQAAGMVAGSYLLAIAGVSERSISLTQ